MRFAVMRHLEALLIDDDALVLGSTSFDGLIYPRAPGDLATVSDTRI